MKPHPVNGEDIHDLTRGIDGLSSHLKLRPVTIDLIMLQAAFGRCQHPIYGFICGPIRQTRPVHGRAKGVYSAGLKGCNPDEMDS